ncbi:hypothetical protein C2E23DRAFT_888368 [Lenzites betulinus]|nr:hypothetical protein C2E23DRAFT_888368 [Lenzites betulinus]
MKFLATNPKPVRERRLFVERGRYNTRALGRSTDAIRGVHPGRHAHARAIISFVQTPFEYQTPASGTYTQTLGVMGGTYVNSEQPFELPRKWLPAPEFSQKRELIVEARETFGKWHGHHVLRVDTYNYAFEFAEYRPGILPYH